MLEDLLKSGNCFKLICGAGKEDSEEVKKLVYIYALAGCRFFDLSANEDVLDSAREALKLANVENGYLCVSVGIKGDPHSYKAVIDSSKCVNCGSCESICTEGAIHYAKVKKEKCIGCSRCAKVCSHQAISYVSEEKDFQKIIPPIIKKGVDCIEFHIIGQDEEEIFSKWEYLNKNYKGMLSVCISRATLSDDALVKRIEKLLQSREPYTTIIQADGFPMNGGKEDFKSTLQAVACAEIVKNAKLPVYLMLSGGTNAKTAQLAHLCEVNYNGIAIGSYARKIIRELLQRKDFWTSKHVQENAVKIAKVLVESV